MSYRYIKITITTSGFYSIKYVNPGGTYYAYYRSASFVYDEPNSATDFTTTAINVAGNSSYDLRVPIDTTQILVTKNGASCPAVTLTPPALPSPTPTNTPTQTPTNTPTPTQTPTQTPTPTVTPTKTPTPTPVWYTWSISPFYNTSTEACNVTCGAFVTTVEAGPNNTTVL